MNDRAADEIPMLYPLVIPVLVSDDLYIQVLIYAKWREGGIAWCGSCDGIPHVECTSIESAVTMVLANWQKKQTGQ